MCLPPHLWLLLFSMLISIRYAISSFQWIYMFWAILNIILLLLENFCLLMHVSLCGTNYVASLGPRTNAHISMILYIKLHLDINWWWLKLCAYQQTKLFFFFFFMVFAILITAIFVWDITKLNMEDTSYNYIDSIFMHIALKGVLLCKFFFFPCNFCDKQISVLLDRLAQNLIHKI